MPADCLSLHADYACQRSGACCTSGWPIHVESGRLARWREAIAAGRLSFAADDAGDGTPFAVPADLPPGAGAVLRTRASGACVFHGKDDGLCAVQCGLGHSSLPVACQHFPRRCLIEPDRVAVSLSHYCPTVARLAFRDDAAPAVVSAPSALVRDIELEGLDARDALPPLLRPGLLADRETYRAWEAFALGVLGREITPESALARISVVTEELRQWTPLEGSLRRRFAALMASSVGVGAVFLDYRSEFQNHQPEEPLRPLEAYELVRDSVPCGVSTRPAPEGFQDLDAALVAPSWADFSRPIRQFLAAHAFGSWYAYNGRGLRTVVRSLDVALALVRVEAARVCAEASRRLDETRLIEAFRAADLLMVHFADPTALGKRLSDVERAQG